MAYLSHSPLIVAQGGLGVATLTAYAPIIGGTTSTGATQQATTNFGTAGYVLTSAGSSAVPVWAAVPGGVPITVTPVVFIDSPYTVLTTDEFLAVDSTAGAINILLEDAPVTGRVITIKDSTGTATGANAMTVTTVSGTDLIDAATSYTINSAYQSINLVFNGTKYLIY